MARGGVAEAWSHRKSVKRVGYCVFGLILNGAVPMVEWGIFFFKRGCGLSWVVGFS